MPCFKFQISLGQANRVGDNWLPFAAVPICHDRSVKALGIGDVFLIKLHGDFHRLVQAHLLHALNADIDGSSEQDVFSLGGFRHDDTYIPVKSSGRNRYYPAVLFQIPDFCSFVRSNFG
ncbi:hypothetical protein SDC9_83190 [bioreactor metagenome]|uniref:Uncharacterized protein n=1 Tax=bioreactor metagenome TaxID=1076179 RepID=A0A644Z9C5_9ZZZZ